MVATCIAPAAHAELLAGMPEQKLPLEQSPTLSAPQSLQMVALPNGGYAVSFGRLRDSTEASMDTYLWYLSEDGSALGQPEVVNTFVRGWQAPAGLAATETGEVVVLIASRDDVEPEAPPGVGRDGDSFGVFARAYDANGVPLGQEFQINTIAAGDQHASDVSYVGSGEFIASWWTYGSLDIRARRFALGGTLLGSEVVIATAPGMTGHGAEIASAGDGSYTAAWVERQGEVYEAKVAAFDSADAPVVTRTLGSGVQAILDIGMADDGSLAVGWANSGSAVESVATYQPSLEPLAAPVAVQGPLLATARNGTWVAIDPGSSGSEDMEMVARTMTGTPTGSPVPLRDSFRPGRMVELDAAMSAAGSVAALLRIVQEPIYASDTWPAVMELYFRKYCSSEDVACDRCTGHDDSIDLDGDFVVDGCDPCVSADDTAAVSRTSVSNSMASEAYPRRSNRIGIRSRFTLPDGVADFASLPVLEHGLRVRIEGAPGGALVDAQLPPGLFSAQERRGWTIKNGVIRYRDGSATPIRGIRKVVLRDRSTAGPRQTDVQVTAAADRYGIAERYSPLRTIIVFGDQQDGTEGRCVETRYVAEECSTEVFQHNHGGAACSRP
ncbi:MAG TPA: hypothetical protein VEC57_05595 [Candidatus Limnocylindrales bacterium]|nr:hypothetical protein [Candidatus Limnocylindrales bacterium]